MLIWLSLAPAMQKIKDLPKQEKKTKKHPVSPVTENAVGCLMQDNK